MNHGYVEQGGIKKIKFKVKWEGYDEIKDLTWHFSEDLTGCTKLVEEYMMNEGLSVEDLEDQEIVRHIWLKI